MSEVKKIQADGGGWEVRLLRVDGDQGDPYDGVEVYFPFGIGTIQLQQEVVDAIIKLNDDEINKPEEFPVDKTTCIHCQGKLTGDNPPAGLMCETFNKEFQEPLFKATLDHAHRMVEFRREEAEILAEKAKKAVGDNPPTALPAGKYIVTDPCYVFDGDFDGSGNDYDRCCDVTLGGDSYGYLRVEGGVCFVFRTNFGDGCYPIYDNGSEVGQTGVDSGQIAFIPYSAPYREKGGHGPIVTLAKATAVEALESRGDFKVGTIEVYTSDDDPHCRKECENCGEYMDDEGRKYRKVSEYDDRYCDYCCEYGVCESCDNMLTEDDNINGHERCEECRDEEDEDE